MRLHRILLLFMGAMVALTALPSPVQAQTATSEPTWRPEHVFAGFGGQLLPTVSSSDSDYCAFVEIVVRHGRVGVGVEATRLGAFHNSSFIRIAGFENAETGNAVMFVIRGRLMQQGRVSVDLVGGAGVHARRSVATVTSQSLSAPAETTITVDHDRSLAFSAGIDAPVRIIRFVYVVPRLRIYVVGDSVMEGLRAPRVRPAAGLSVRGLW